MSASDRTRAAGRRKMATRGYTGTQKDDYTGTPSKTTTKKPKPKPRPKGAAYSNMIRKGKSVRK